MNLWPILEATGFANGTLARRDYSNDYVYYYVMTRLQIGRAHV